MSRVRQREIFWDYPAETNLAGAAIYAGNPAVGGQFLADVDAGGIEPIGEVSFPDNSYPLDSMPDGNWQFAVCTMDEAQNFSDPYQHPGWQNVPLDQTPPGPVSGGGLRII
jgi:hypothetical protein